MKLKGKKTEMVDVTWVGKLAAIAVTDIVTAGLSQWWNQMGTILKRKDYL